MLKSLVGAAALVFSPGFAAVADEDAVKLKFGEGVEAVERNCTACHSLDYIQMNSVFLDQKGWQAEVAKMVKIFGAPVDEEDQARIFAYLAATYGKR
jgi:sulfite dehydrogenase (cytochrome) subunit B